MLLSFSIPVYASSDTSTTFWQFIENYLDGSLFNDFCHNLSDSWDTLTDAEKDTAYQNYVNTLPVNGFGSSGLYWVPSYSCKAYVSSDYPNTSYSGSLNPLVCHCPQYSGCGVDFASAVIAPFAGIFVPVFSASVPRCSCSVSSYNAVSGTVLASCGSGIFTLYNLDSQSDWSISWFFCYKISNYDSSYNSQYSPSSRPAGIVNNCTITNTITNSDNTTTTNSYNLTVPIIDDLVGVDNNFVFTDPLTGVGITLDNWWYDYVTRRYNFSYTDNSTSVNGSVTYGDENITVVNGDTTTIYNYPAPAADPDPTPTDSVGWLEKIYNKVCQVLQAVLGIDTSPNVTVNTTGTDITVTVPSADGTDDQDWKFSDMKAKFGWIHEIHTIISSFVSDVTGDSETAYAMAASPALLSDDGSTSAQAVSSSGSSSAAPSIAIDFGQAQSVYGYNYGGSMQVLDLSWYTQYKPTVDVILSGFLWILFLWGIFKHAPSIISGGDVVENQMDDISKGSRGRKS